MELDDCAFPLLAGVDITDDPRKAFDGASVALLVGARPRGPGMERADLLQANGGIFKPQGEAINAGRRRRHPGAGGRQPGQHQRPDRPHARARRPRRPVQRDDAARPQPGAAQVAKKLDVPSPTSARMTIWGNHSASQYPDLFHARSAAGRWPSRSTAEWLREHLHPDRRQARRGDHRRPRASSAASAANAAIDHVQSWVLGTPEGRLGERGHRVRRLLRRARGAGLRVPRDFDRTAPGRSCRAWRSTSSPAARSTPRSPSWPTSGTRSRVSG